MSEFKGIPIAHEPRPAGIGEPRLARSGEKYTTPQGYTAIKDGIKTVGVGPSTLRKPPWLRAPMASGAAFSAVKGIVREHRLSTVCRSEGRDQDRRRRAVHAAKTAVAAGAHGERRRILRRQRDRSRTPPEHRVQIGRTGSRP